MSDVDGMAPESRSADLSAPPGVTAAKLLEIADYIDGTDSIIIQILRRSGVPDDLMEDAGLAGSQMQNDLRTWAAGLDSETGENAP